MTIREFKYAERERTLRKDAELEALEESAEIERSALLAEAEEDLLKAKERYAKLVWDGLGNAPAEDVFQCAFEDILNAESAIRHLRNM